LGGDKIEGPHRRTGPAPLERPIEANVPRWGYAPQVASYLGAATSSQISVPWVSRSRNMPTRKVKEATTIG
jgi:hypothetical protein